MVSFNAQQLSHATAKNKTLESELQRDKALLDEQTRNLSDARLTIENLHKEMSNLSSGYVPASTSPYARSDTEDLVQRISELEQKLKVCVWTLGVVN